MTQDKKLILVDCDGVILDWETHFHNYMQSQGHQKVYSKDQENSYYKERDYGLSQIEAEKMVYHFNTSAWMLSTPPYKDARQGIARLLDAGYKFVAITALGLDPYGREARCINLERLFGHNTFVDVIVTDFNYTDVNVKRSALEAYADHAVCWVEDSIDNATLGADLGIKTYLMDHLYNQHFVADERIQRVSDWQDICNRLLD